MSGASVVNDPTLEWRNFQSVALNVPHEVFYQDTTSTNVSDSNATFYVKAPAANALLDNMALIKWTLRISSTVATNFTDYAEGAGANNVVASTNSNRLALRQGWCMNRAMQNISLTINGSNISAQPIYWMNALNRLYMSEEEARAIGSLSGGAFDTGYQSGHLPSDTHNYAASLAVGAAWNGGQQPAIVQTAGNSITFVGGDGPSTAVPVAVANDMGFYHSASIIPKDSQHRNEGFDRRFNRFMKLHRATGDADAVVGGVNVILKYPATFDIEVWERIPIAPFYLYEGRDHRMSIPNIKDMTLNISFASDLVKKVIQGNLAQANLTTTLTLSANTQADPVLKLRWMIPNNMSIPDSVSIPIWRVREYTQSASQPVLIAASADAVSSSVTQSYNNIDLEGIPDLLLMFYRLDLASQDMNSTGDQNLEIESMQLQIGGSAGKLTSLDAGQLYQIWLNNLSHRGQGKAGFDEFRKYCCVAALRPHDYGAVAGPGFDYPVQLTIKNVYRKHQKIPSMFANANALLLDAGTYEFYIAAFYNRVSLTLNSSGGSSIKMLKVPRQAGL